MKKISKSEAAALAGVSRQMINKLTNSNKYNFFTDDGKVDIESQSWKDYISDRGFFRNKEFPIQEKETIEENDEPIVVPKKEVKCSIGSEPSKEKPKEKEKIKPSFSDRNEYGITAGFNPGDFHPDNPQQLKALVGVIKDSLEMRIKLGEYIKRDILATHINTISHHIQIMFVDLARKVSTDICEKLDRLGMEREVEKIIAPVVSKGIEDIKRECEKTRKVK